MSYYVELKFTKVKDGDEALKIMSKYRELSTLDNFKSRIDRASYELYWRYLACSQGMGITPKFCLSERINKILTREMFITSFVYYEDYKVLGILKPTGVKEIDDLFSREFCFQNSCGIDYDWEEWNDLIEYFPCVSEIINKWKNKEESYFMHFLDDEDLTQKESAIDKYRKIECYNEIEKFLCIGDILSNRNIITFEILPNAYNFYQLKSYVLKVVREEARKEGKLNE